MAGRKKTAEGARFHTGLTPGGYARGMKRLFDCARTVLLFCVLPVFAMAESVPLLNAEQFQERAQEFLGGDGAYGPVDANTLSFELEDQLPETDSVFWQHGRLNPFAKAALLIELADGPLEHYRLHFTVERLQLDTGAAPLPAVLLQVDRYNLGPALRAEYVEELGEENTGTPEEFGVGPDVSWRFLMAQVQGIYADVQGAARSSDLAPGATCFEGPCGDPGSTLPGSIVWQEETPADPVPSDNVAQLFPALPFPVQLLELADSAGWLNAYGSEGGELEAGLDVNLGQDAGSILTVHSSGLLDDSVTAIWQQLGGLPGFEGQEPAFFYREAFQCQRGDEDFAPAGSFCP